MPLLIPRTRATATTSKTLPLATSSTISLAKASAVLQIEGSRASRQSYERVGRMVVEEPDLPDRHLGWRTGSGRGGTTQIVEEALAQHTPVVWLNASEPKGPCILRAYKSGKRQTHALDEAEVDLSRALF